MESIRSVNEVQIPEKKNMDEKKKVFEEISLHLVEEKSPSIYLNDLSRQIIFRQEPYSMLNKLKDTEQSPIYHPEGSAWNHTMLVVDEAASVRDKSNNAEVFMWAALLHDIGKPATTRLRKGKITAYDHDVAGAELAEKFLQYFTQTQEFIQDVVHLVRWHMHILYVLKDLPFSRIEEMKKQVDLHELALLGLCDRMGRLNVDRQKEEENMNLFLKICNQKERK